MFAKMPKGILSSLVDPWSTWGQRFLGVIRLHGGNTETDSSEALKKKKFSKGDFSIFAWSWCYQEKVLY